ncbi:hypothetical protein BJ508DRAFT_333508 [Ascobolus immersus RN42]|uniref:Uncharacterized protein n=1 Tax=Ascobolus immersus RN42 TaxID=1160509 RepID=A0A3N4HL57_ASCIM|nr:hypothetical protein BJ508DRAFT_333508 [Ascobolus immersus RN42]
MSVLTTFTSGEPNSASTLPPIGLKPTNTDERERRSKDSPQQSLYHSASLPLTTFTNNSNRPASRTSEDSEVIHMNDSFGFITTTSPSSRRLSGDPTLDGTNFVPPAPVQSILFDRRDKIFGMLGMKTTPVVEQPLDDLKVEIEQLEKTFEGLLDEQVTSLLGSKAGEQSTQLPQHSSDFGAASHSSYHQSTPPPRPRELKKIRRFLTRTMEDLAHVKRREQAICAEESAKRRREILRLERWEQLQNSLTGELAEICEDIVGQRVEGLAKHYEKLNNEISDLEQRLAELKEERRNVATQLELHRKRLTERTGPTETQLQNLNKTITTYLRTLPEPLESVDAAKEKFQNELKNFEEDMGQSRTAEISLQNQIKVWGDVCAIIQAFEERMKERVSMSVRRRVRPPQSQQGRDSPELTFKSGLGRRKLASSANGSLNSSTILPSSSPPPLVPSPPHTDAEGGERLNLETLEDLQNVLDTLQEMLREAQERHWMMLYCCILHEVEAFTIALRQHELALGFCILRPKNSLVSHSMPNSNLPKVSEKPMTPVQRSQFDGMEDPEDDFFANSNPWSSWSSPAHTKPSSPIAAKRTPTSGPSDKDGKSLDSHNSMVEDLLAEGIDEEDIEELERTIVLSSNPEPQQRSEEKSAFWDDNKKVDELVDVSDVDTKAQQPKKETKEEPLVDFGRASSEHSREEEDPVPSDFLETDDEREEPERKTGVESDLAGLRLDGK